MKILFICTHNRCRSILAEAITCHLGKGILHVASAGSAAEGVIHPETLTALERVGVPVDGLHSKSLDEVKLFNPDVVITVCDSAANEACPLWLGAALKVHWGLPDPSRHQGSSQEREQAFDQITALLTSRISRLMAELSNTSPPGDMAALLNALAAS
jgi:arsenate reductase